MEARTLMIPPPVKGSSPYNFQEVLASDDEQTPSSSSMLPTFACCSTPRSWSPNLIASRRARTPPLWRIEPLSITQMYSNRSGIECEHCGYYHGCKSHLVPSNQ